MTRDEQTWAIAGATALGVGVVGGITWLATRSPHGPPREGTLRPGGSVPAAPQSAPELPKAGPKSTAYPGAPGSPTHPSQWLQIASGPGLRVRRPTRAWATPKAAASIVNAAQRFRQIAPELGLSSYELAMGDASKKGGGALPPHKSHHEGRDVDISIEGGLPPVALPLLLQAFLEDDNVKTIYLAWPQQKLVWDAIGVNPEFSGLRPELQYPNLPGTGRTRVRHWRGHTRHIHVRFRE